MGLSVLFSASRIGLDRALGSSAYSAQLSYLGLVVAAVVRVISTQIVAAVVRGD